MCTSREDRQGMRTRLVLIGAVVLLVIFAVLAARNWLRSKPTPQSARVAGPQPKSLPAAQSGGVAPRPLHGQNQLVAQILEQGLTPERARLLFSMVVGPLPGVSPPPDSRDPADFDGTLAVSYIYQVWSSLTPEQRQAALRLIRRAGKVPGGNVGTLHSSWSPDHAVLMPVALTLPQVPAWDYEQMAKDANDTLSVLLGVPPVQFVVNVDYDPPEGTEYAHAWSWWKPNDPNKPDRPDVPLPWGCELSIHDQKFVPLNGVDAKAIVTHEMTHCFQDRVTQTATAMFSVHPWISEGEATWAMSAIVPEADAVILGNKWSPYVNQPTTVYAKRSYDAIGVYGHLSDLAGDEAVWPKLLPMVKIGIGGNDSDAFTALVEGHHIEYFASWGSSYFVVSGNKPWTMTGPGTPPTTGPAPQTITIDPQFNDVLPPAGPYQGELFQLSGNADIAMVSLLTGYGRLHDQGFSLDTALDASGPLALCLKQGGCKCPDGSPGASMFTKNAVAPLSIGINGGDTTAQVGVVARSLDDFCKKPEPNNPAAPPGGGGSGGGGGGGDDNDNRPPPPPPPEGATWGDTHLATFDGLGYDFQVVGEYTLVRSTKDDFIVQVRQVPVLGPKVASVNQAVATRIGGQRVTFTMENSAPVLRIDGKVSSGPLPKLKAGSLTGAATAYGGTYQLTWPDGTVLRVEQLGSYAINVRVKPAAARHGSLAGLLGDFDGSQANDLIGKNNSKLGMGFSRDDLNHSLADAWRVTRTTSLFDYQPGQSTSSFNDPNFPAKDADAARLANRDTAEKTCREHGITDQRLLDDCILDLAVTNSFVFGGQYAHAQQVLAARAALTRPRSTLPKLATLWVKGEILDSKSEPEFHFNGKQGDVIWIGHDPNCKDSLTPGHPVFLWLADPAGKRIDAQAGCDFGRVELPTSGTYTFRGVFKYKNDIVRYNIPVRFVRPDRRQQISYGQMVSGNIEQWAAHDVYTWTGKAGDLIVLSGKGCDLKFFTAILDPEGHSILGPSCRTGTYWKLPRDGTYQLVVNSGEWAHAEAIGPYHFVFQGGKLAQ